MFKIISLFLVSFFIVSCRLKEIQPNSKIPQEILPCDLKIGCMAYNNQTHGVHTYSVKENYYHIYMKYNIDFNNQYKQIQQYKQIINADIYFLQVPKEGVYKVVSDTLGLKIDEVALLINKISDSSKLILKDGDFELIVNEDIGCHYIQFCYIPFLTSAGEFSGNFVVPFLR
jgi:hypothetical protein